MQSSLHSLYASTARRLSALVTTDPSHSVYLPLASNNNNTGGNSSSAIGNGYQRQDKNLPHSVASSSASSGPSSSSNASSQPSPRPSITLTSPFTKLTSWSGYDPGNPISASALRKPFAHNRPLQACLYASFLLLAAFGLAVIVAIPLGLVQRTPLLSEKMIMDSGWTRRPIHVGAGSGKLSKAPAIYQGITIQDFTPSYPDDQVDNDLLQETKPGMASPPKYHATVDSFTPSSSLHLLILCPVRNSVDDLPNLFRQLDTLQHPFSNTSLGFLVGDETEATGDVLLDLVQERMASESRRYRHVTLLHKDFNVAMPAGANRHSYVLQLQRRSVMARARTYLVTSTLEPSVDWVLWLDSDIDGFSPSLFQDLLVYGNGGVVDISSDNAVLQKHLAYQQAQTNRLITERQKLEGGWSSASMSASDHQWNDIIIPNAMRRNPDGTLLGFDMNNWSETPESRKLKAGMAADHLLIEGNIWQHMQRQHLADFYQSYINASSSHQIQSEGPQIFSSEQVRSMSPDDPRLDIDSPAYIGKLMGLDGIGGVAALVRAEVHRMGAIFPSWIFENQIETEAFGVLASRLGARTVGLPNLFVLHRKWDSTSLRDHSADGIIQGT